MVDLLDLVQVYDDALDSDLCQIFIDNFEQFTDKHERIENDRKPNFTQLNITELAKENDEINVFHKILIQTTFKYKKEYYSFIDERCFPEKHAFEQFRIKKYNNNGQDAFDCHVDVMDHSSARRYLAFLWYLNDVEEGGETVFAGMEIKPKAGKLIVFPPMWMFPHIGKPPISNNKYIISTYLHYK